jgi:hypothetical protein
MFERVRKKALKEWNEIDDKIERKNKVLKQWSEIYEGEKSMKSMIVIVLVMFIMGSVQAQTISINSNQQQSQVQVQKQSLDDLNRILILEQIEKTKAEKIYYQNCNKVIGEYGKLIDVAKVVLPTIVDKVAENNKQSNPDKKESIELRNQQIPLFTIIVKELVKEKPDSKTISDSILNLMELDKKASEASTREWKEDLKKEKQQNK